ncbi:TauD/TfdA family dioxygenase [Leptolyngbya boryana CZ1]|uniref:TauD/TfdA family dioxygenase n=1 Tax=Leptolyngbya boryana CZ1 TaxID=3060204 RepID=A0AA97ANC7_LEPBY|nr:TauD/TfdA family dioxygenase [Leptolyngbya boryana]WNZ43914.1 TauD/TfdA family dioxygenase [Leptolyngbya boryana CZ1]
MKNSKPSLVEKSSRLLFRLSCSPLRSGGVRSQGQCLPVFQRSESGSDAEDTTVLIPAKTRFAQAQTHAAADSIAVFPLSPCIGAEIQGIDLQVPLTQDQRKTLQMLCHRYKVLFFRDQSLSVEQMRSLLQDLSDHYKLPEFQCRFRWTPNAIAFWDNWACQHYAINDYYPQTRIMERLSLVSWHNDNSG